MDFKTLLSGSKPQFLDGDPKLINDVGGLAPNKEEHDIFIHFDLVSFKKIRLYESNIFSGYHTRHFP